MQVGEEIEIKIERLAKASLGDRMVFNPTGDDDQGYQ